MENGLVKYAKEKCVHSLLGGGHWTMITVGFVKTETIAEIANC